MKFNSITRTVLLIPVFALINFVAFAQLTVQSIEVGTSIENRELVGADSTFSSDVNTLYCHTTINGAENEPTIKHVWYYNGEEQASINLNVRSENFRTWSSKKIWHTWTGNWKVEVLDANDNVLASKEFTIKP